MKTARVDCRGGHRDGELLDIRDEPDAVHPDRDGDYRRIGTSYVAVFVPEGRERRSVDEGLRPGAELRVREDHHRRRGGAVYAVPRGAP
jgi:hypothetical protein